MEIILSILSGLVPALISQAEGLIGKPADSKDLDWVHGMVREIVQAIEKGLPGWAKPPLDEIEKLVVQLVQAELEKLK